MHPAGPPALPFTVGADRAGAIRRRRVAFPVALLAAALGGVAIGVGFGALVTGPAVLGLLCGAVLVVAAVVLVAALPRTRRPPDADWLFRLEPDGVRFPPHPRARRAAPDHQGSMVPWPLVTGSTPRRLNGEPLIVLGLRPDAEPTLVGQGWPPAQARLAARRGFRLRLTGSELDPAECLRLLESTRAERVTAR